jgi:hypothetical protein
MARCMKCQTTSLRKVGGDPWQDRIRVEPEARLQMHAPLIRSNAAYWNHTTSPQTGESLRGQDHVNGALPGCPGGNTMAGPHISRPLPAGMVKRDLALTIPGQERPLFSLPPVPDVSLNGRLARVKEVPLFYSLALADCTAK